MLLSGILIFSHSTSWVGKLPDAAKELQLIVSLEQRVRKEITVLSRLPISIHPKVKILFFFVFKNLLAIF